MCAFIAAAVVVLFFLFFRVFHGCIHRRVYVAGHRYTHTYHVLHIHTPHNQIHMLRKMFIWL